MKIENRGGKRNGSGRKKLKDKKIQIPIAPRVSQVKKLGGRQNVIRVAMNAVETATRLQEILS